MFKNNLPRYWVNWFDRWHLLVILVLLLLLCWLGYTLTLPAPQVTLGVADPAAVLQSDKPVQLKGLAPANSIVRVFDGDKLLNELHADANGNFAITLPNLAAGAHAFKATTDLNGAQITSPFLR